MSNFKVRPLVPNPSPVSYYNNMLFREGGVNAHDAFIPMSGTPGPSGEPGPSGIQGPTGPSGIQGPVGPSGLDPTLYSSDTDPFGRKRLLFKADNNFLKLGQFGADGDPENRYTDGIVAVGANSQGVFDQSNYCYARIKPTRFGIFNTISGNQVYTFRVDTADFYLKDNANNKTFDFNRLTGDLTLHGSLSCANVNQAGTVRPSNPAPGQQFLDLSLSPARPIWYTGSNWVDASGTIA